MCKPCSSRTPLWLAFLVMCALMLAQGAWAGPPYTISYTLSSAGRVSMNIYDANGHVVRELLHADSESTGNHSQTWDGNDRNGNPVSNPDSCTWKLLETPDGLHAHYMQSLATFPFAPTPVWLAGAQNCAGIGVHNGPRSVAVDSSGVYMGVGISESCPNAIKMGLDGSYQWTAWQPNAWMGRYAMASMDGTLYQLEQDAYVMGQGTNTPNNNYATVGHRPGNGNYVGFYWDCMWAGDNRTPSGAYPQTSCVEAEGMDMDAYDCGGTYGGQQLVVSYAAHNAVRWYTPMPNGGNNSTEGPIPNSYLSQVTVTAPKGVAIDNNGNVLVTSGSSVIKIAYSSHTQTTLISGLTNPTKIAVDHNTGEILVAANKQIKRFTSSGSPVGDYPTYGAAGGGQMGLYNANNFFNITDICADPNNSGAFYVTETGEIETDGVGGVRRLVHFARDGSIMHQWFAGAPWCPYAAADPDDPTVVWTPLDRDPNQGIDWIARLTLDYANNTYTIHSIYKVAGLANGLTQVGTLGCGLSVWKVLKHTDQHGHRNTYLCYDNGGRLQVLRVDTSNWTAVPVVVGEFGTDRTDPDTYAYLWTDGSNGGACDGVEQTGERVTDNGFINFACRSVQIDANFDYYYLRTPGYGYDYPKIVKLAPTGWTHDANGDDWAPIYPDLQSADTTAFTTTFPSDLYVNGSFAADTTQQDNNFAFGADGSVYINANVGETGWGAYSDSHEVKWDANGNFCWEVGKAGANHNYSDVNHTVNPGEIWCAFRTGAGVTHDCVIATDFQGGNANRSDWTAFAYCWDSNGLWVGNPFETGNCDTSTCPIDRYTLSSEDGSASLYTDIDGTVYYYGGQESEVRVYKITGWSDSSNPWDYQSGSVTGGNTQCAAPTFNPAAGTYSSAQNVTISTTTQGATIRYTTDGTAPSETNGTVYSNAVNISSSCTLKAIAYKNGMTDSTVTSGAYTISGTTATQINCGGSDASPYVADTGYTGSSGSYSTTATIDTSGVTNPAPQAVYQSERYGPMTYTITGLTANAPYTVRLHFAEIYWTAANQRKFNVSINGTQVLSDFDIYATAGAANKAVVESFNTNADSSGNITIDFTNGSVDNAKIDGIEVLVPTYTHIDCGNMSGSADSPFVSDDTANYYTDGYTASKTATITTSSVVNPAPMSVYQTERADPCTYTITGLTPNGSYIVRLHFSENWWTSAGNREFNVSINGTQVLTNYDIFADAGGQYIATVHDFAATADSNGQITISTTNVLDHASLHGIEILSGVSQCAAPTFSPAAGTYTGTQTVTFSTGTTGATIRYTTDGSLPSETHGTVGTSVDISANTTLKAIAYKTGMADSTVASGDYTIQCAAPTFNPAGGTYSSAQSVTISCGTSGATIRYTTDGSTPSETNGTVYSGAVNISSSCTLKAIAYKSGLADSTVTSEDYTIVTAVHIDCGNTGASADSPFVPDEDFSGGYSASKTNTITTSSVVNPAPMSVYQTERADPCTYTVTGLMPNGSYIVRLHFSENWWTSAGNREFNVSINGTQVLTNYDIFADAGGQYIATVHDFAATADGSGQITISTTNVLDHASLHGIEILSGVSQCAAPTFSPTAGTYTGAQTVTLSSGTTGATIRYTTDGSLPSETHGTVGTSVTISSSCTLKAIAYKAGMADSTVTSGAYTINPDVTDHLVCRWNFDSNADDTAPNGTANPGTLVNSPTYSTSSKQVGSASLNLDDTAMQYVSVADQADLDPTDQITLCAWVNATDWNGNRRILQKGTDGAQYRLLAEYNVLKFELNVSGTTCTITTTLPSTGVWHHIAATFDGTTMKLYVDGGTPVTGSYSGSIGTTTSALYIGTKVSGDSTTGDYFKGLLDDVRIYSGKALTQAEIQTVMAVTQ